MCLSVQGCHSGIVSQVTILLHVTGPLQDNILNTKDQNWNRPSRLLNSQTSNRICDQRQIKYVFESNMLRQSDSQTGMLRDWGFWSLMDWGIMLLWKSRILGFKHWGIWVLGDCKIGGLGYWGIWGLVDKDWGIGR